MHQASEVKMKRMQLLMPSALTEGDGGTVVLWSDIFNTNSATSVLGEIYAKGGSSQAMVVRWKPLDTTWI